MPLLHTAFSEFLQTGSPIGHSATSHYEIKCAPGYQCISKVLTFGLGHDGSFKPPPLIMHSSDPNWRRFVNAYEVGCPARGKVSGPGLCMDDGSKGKNLCWASTRYEAGEGAPCDNEGKCLCVRPTAANGAKARGGKSLEIKKGVEVRYGRFLVTPPDKCDDCRQHDLNKKVCEECKNCDFSIRSVAGKKIRGCWFKDFQKARRARLASVEGRTYLKGENAKEKELAVIPHYPIWDPAGAPDPPGEEDANDAEDAADADDAEIVAGARMPYQWRPETLSRKAWIRKYQEAAPRVQQLMDALDGTATSTWASQTFLGSNDGRNLKRVEKAVSVQRACLQMQELARSIAPRATFADKSGGASLQCVKEASGEDGQLLKPDCVALNCYASSPDWKSAMAKLQSAR